MDKRTVIPLILLTMVVLMPIGSADAVSEHLGGEGHGDGIDVVYSSGEECIATVKLAKLPLGDVVLSFISLADGQSVGPIEASRTINVYLEPLTAGLHTVLVTMHETGEVIAECEMDVYNALSVRYSAEGGTGYMPPSEVRSGSAVVLANNSFTPPAGKSFLYWQIDGASYQPGSAITVTKDVEVKAVWSDAVYKITFSPGEGTGSMNPINLSAGEKLTLPLSSFTPPDGKSFSGWKIEDKIYKAGDIIVIGSDMQFTAQYSSGTDMTIIIAISAAIVVALLIVVIILMRRKS